MAQHRELSIEPAIIFFCYPRRLLGVKMQPQELFCKNALKKVLLYPESDLPHLVFHITSIPWNECLMHNLWWLVTLAVLLILGPAIAGNFGPVSWFGVLQQWCCWDYTAQNTCSSGAGCWAGTIGALRF